MMSNNKDKVIVRILTDMKMYAEIAQIKDGRKVAYIIGYHDEYNGTRDFRKYDRIDPFADTLEGRKQLDVIENWMRTNGYHREFILTDPRITLFHDARVHQVHVILDYLSSKPT